MPAEWGSGPPPHPNHTRLFFLSDSDGKQFICKAARGDHHKQGSDVISETAALIQHLRETKEPFILEEVRAQGAASLKLSGELILCQCAAWHTQ